MAVINGSFASNSKNLQPYIDYSYTQNTDAVTTTVTAKLYVKKLTSYGNTYNSSTPYSLSIGGTVVASGSKSVNMSSVSTGSSVLVASGSRTLSHTSSGTLRATLSGVVDWTGSNPGKGTVSGTVNFPTIIVNTPPTMSGSLSISPSGTIAENTSAINLSWTKASDSQGNANKYQIYRYVNGTHDKTIDISSINTVSYSDTTVGSFGQGTKIYYKIWAGDSYGTWSNAITSSTVTKNTMSGATLSSSSSITSSFSNISFNWSGASNTNGNTSFTYDLIASGITVYRGTGLTGTSLSVAIVSSAPSSGAYILKSDLINKFKSSNFNGSLSFNLKTKNAYGSTKDSGKTISVNIRSTPTAGRPTISENQTYSTAFKTVSSTGNKYFLPNGTDKIRIDWTSGSDILGQPISYDVQYKLGNGGFITAASNLTGNAYDLILPKQSITQSIVTRIVTKTSYGYTSSYDSPAKTLHYYNAPSIDVVDINRTDTTASAIIALRHNTSIPNINFVARYAGLTTGTLTNTTSNQTISATGLTGANTYTWTIYVKDNAFTSTEVSKVVKVPTYTPLFSVREKGVGINAIPDGTADLIVNGSISTKELKIGSKNLLDMVYPVGSIYMSVVNVNPSTLFGGTWVAWGAGKVPVGVNASETEFNAVEKTGGAKSYSASHTHTTAAVALTVAQLPAHNHSASTNSTGAHTHNIQLQKTKWGYTGTTNANVVIDADTEYTAISNKTTTSAGGHSHTVTVNNAGSGQTHGHGNTGGSSVSLSSIQPYITCYMWKRTA